MPRDAGVGSSRVQNRAPSLAPSGAPSGAPSRRIDAVVERLLLEGADRLSSADLLALVLGGTGAMGARGREAWAVLDAMETLRRASCASVGELCAAASLPPASAARLAAAFALGRRAASEGVARGAPFSSSVDIFERFHPLLRDVRRERFLCVMLDAKNRVMRHEAVSEGSLTSSLVHPREVFAAAIRESAGGLVLVHNHPSGDPEPSPEDIEITRRLCAVGDLVGIRILDHVVIGDGRFVSFLDRGWIPP